MPKKPPETAGDVGLYVYYRTLICALDRAKAQDARKDEVKRDLSKLLRARSGSFEPHTLAQGLNVSLLPGKENVEPEIARLEKALAAAPDSYYGWDGLIHLYLEQAELRAQARDVEGVRASYRSAAAVVARGQKALDVHNGRRRSPTEAIALRVLLLRHVELLVTQDKDTTSAGSMLSDKDVSDASRRGKERRARIRNWTRGL